MDMIGGGNENVPIQRVNILPNLRVSLSVFVDFRHYDDVGIKEYSIDISRLISL